MGVRTKVMENTIRDFLFVDDTAANATILVGTEMWHCQRLFTASEDFGLLIRTIYNELLQ